MNMLEGDLAKELTKGIHNPLFLSKFKIRAKKTDISAVIPTHNRCPYAKTSENYKYNPLSVCMRTLLLQKSPIKEIVVVDDASTDFTEDVVKELTKEADSKGISIIYIKNEQRKGSSIARNIGAKRASGKYLFFLDDDCVPAPYLSFISAIVIKKIEEYDKQFAVLVLPAYDRASFPRRAISLSDLATTFFKRGIKSAAFNSIPAEYLSLNDKFLNKNLKIFMPLQVFQTWGHFIIDRKKYLDVDGFPGFATWPNKAGEEQEFACRLIENAYTLYYLPDAKASSFHGAFGAKIGGFRGKDWLAGLTHGQLCLSKFSKLCNQEIISGNRVSVDDFFYSKIIAAFCIIYKRNIKEAINYTKKSYQEFVVENKETWYGGYAKHKISSREKREEIWHRAIDDGLNLLFETEQKKLSKLSSFITSLKEKGRIGEEKKKSKIKRMLEQIYRE